MLLSTCMEHRQDHELPILPLAAATTPGGGSTHIDDIPTERETAPLGPSPDEEDDELIDDEIEEEPLDSPPGGEPRH